MINWLRKKHILHDWGEWEWCTATCSSPFVNMITKTNTTYEREIRVRECLVCRKRQVKDR